MDGPQAFINTSGAEKGGQVFQDIGLIFRVHGQVGLVPLAENSQPDEFFPLDIDELESVFPAFFADLGNGELRFFAPKSWSTLISMGRPW